jgi:hypothetical protein
MVCWHYLSKIEGIYIYSQTCIKRSPLGQRKIKRGSIHVKFSVTGQEIGDL